MELNGRTNSSIAPFEPRPATTAPGAEFKALLAEVQRALRGKTRENEFGQTPVPVQPNEIEQLRPNYNTNVQERLARWKARGVKYAEDMMGYRASWLLYLLSYDGKADLGIGPDNKVSPVGLPGYIPQECYFRINRLPEYILGAASDLDDLRTLYVVSPRTANSDDQDAARMATKVASIWLDRQDYRTARMTKNVVLPLTGNAVLGVEWDERAFSTILGAGNQRKYGRHGDVTFEWTPAERFLVPTGVSDFEQMDSFIVEQPRSLNWMIDHYGAEKVATIRPPKDDDQWRTSFWNPQPYHTSLIGNVRAMSGTSQFSGLPGADALRAMNPYGSAGFTNTPYVLQCCYERFVTDAGDIWWRTVVCQGVVIEDGPYAPRDGKDNNQLLKMKDGRILAYPQPFVLYRYFEQPGCFWGRGLTKQLLPIQWFLQHLDTSVAIGSLENSVPMLFHSIADEPKPKFSRGYQTFAYSGERPPTVEQGQGPSLSLIQVIAMYEAKMDRIAMRPQVLRGESDAESSGRKVDTLGANAMQMSNIVRSANNDGDVRLLSKALVLFQMMATEERLLGVDPNDTTGSIRLKGADLRGHTSVKVLLEWLWSLPKDRRIEVITTLMERGVISQQYAHRILNANSVEEMQAVETLQAEEARRMLAEIERMPETEVVEILTVVAKAVAMTEQKVAMTPELKANPMKARIEVERVKNDVLLAFGIGCEDFHEAGVHLEETDRYLLSATSRALSPQHQVLLRFRRAAIMAKRNEPALSQQAAQMDAQNVVRQQQELQQKEAQLGQLNSQAQQLEAQNNPATV